MGTVAKGEHILVIDEINHADLARVLGEAVALFEAGEPDRTVQLPHAIRRCFAFIEMWPDLTAVEAEGKELAIGAFTDTVTTFSEFADDETLRLVPGHAYFLDPRPDKAQEGSTRRVAHRIKFELLPLLRHYLEEKMCGAAGEPIAGLADRIESRLLQLGERAGERSGGGDLAAPWGGPMPQRDPC